MASVYRIIFAPDVEVSEFRKGTDRYDECRAEIFERFKKHKFIGTGWGSLPLKAGMSEADIRVAANAPTGQIENFRCLCEIAENDLKIG